MSDITTVKLDGDVFVKVGTLWEFSGNKVGLFSIPPTFNGDREKTIDEWRRLALALDEIVLLRQELDTARGLCGLAADEIERLMGIMGKVNDLQRMMSESSEQ